MSELVDASAHVALDEEGNIIHPDDDPDLSLPVVDTDSFDDIMEQMIREEAHAEAVRQLREAAKAAGPSVALGVRAAKLVEAIDSASEANSLNGYLQVGHIRHYEAVARKESRLRGSSKKAFRYAFGYEAMIAAGYSEEAVTADLEEEYSNFEGQYLLPGKAGKRAKLKKSLQAP